MQAHSAASSPNLLGAIVATLLWSVVSGPLTAERLEVDTSHSYVGFEIGIAGGLSTVEGRFTGVEGALEYDLDDLPSSTIRLRIDPTTIDTGNETRDEHLRSDDFFHVASFPAIDFESRSIEVDGQGFVVTGPLTLRGHRQEIRLTVRRNHEAPLFWFQGRATATFEVTGSLDRTDFGIEAPRRWRHPVQATGELAMSDRVDLRIHVVASSDPVEAAAATARVRGVTRALEQLKSLDRHSREPAPWGTILNSLGYRLLPEDPSSAIAIFEEAVRLHPDSANAHDSLGEAYVRGGRERDAIESYTEALRLDPGNDNARRVLDDLQGHSPEVGTESLATAELRFPVGLAAVEDHLYVSERSAQRIRRIDRGAGTIDPWVGTGTRGYRGDGGPAISAWLFAPNDVVVDPDGNLVLSDTFNHRIRRVDASTGRIETIVGTGAPGYSGDGGPATAARIRGPYGLTYAADGSLLFADTDNHAIRRVDGATGVIETVAGVGGDPGFSGDGGPATSARLRRPHKLVATPNGDLLIGDSFNQRIRRVDGESRIIDTIAGDGEHGTSPAGTAAENVQFGFFGCLLLTAEDRLIVTEVTNDRVVAFDLRRPEPVLEVLAEGIRTPLECLLDRNGDLLVAEAASPDTTGRIVLVDLQTGHTHPLTGTDVE